MQVSRANMVLQLKEQLAALERRRFRSQSYEQPTITLRNKNGFPEKILEPGAIHEFIVDGRETSNSTAGFISGILADRMKKREVAIWISPKAMVYPPGLTYFCLAPEQIIFLQLQKPADMLWAMEESLKCAGVTAVVGELGSLSFTASRRLQLAVENSKALGFVLRQHSSSMQPTASVTRWQITSLAANPPEGIPGVGFPKWKVQLLKIRHGKPATWEVEWRGGRLRAVEKTKGILHTAYKRSA